jgi:hypothetical protein
MNESKRRTTFYQQFSRANATILLQESGSGAGDHLTLLRELIKTQDFIDVSVKVTVPRNSLMASCHKHIGSAKDFFHACANNGYTLSAKNNRTLEVAFYAPSVYQGTQKEATIFTITDPTTMLVERLFENRLEELSERLVAAELQKAQDIRLEIRKKEILRELKRNDYNKNRGVQYFITHNV